MEYFAVWFIYAQDSPELTIAKNRKTVKISIVGAKMRMVRSPKHIFSRVALEHGNPLRQILRENNLRFFADLIRRFFCHEITATFYSGTTIAAIDQRNRICRFAFAAGGQAQDEKRCDHDTKFLFHRHLHGALDTMTFVPFVVRSIFMR